MVLGFLAEGPLHGYELRRKMGQLHGYARTISDGTIYPAIKRLVRAGHVTETIEPGRGNAPRKTLTLTNTGHDRLRDLLRNAHGHAITDGDSFFVVLSFLSHLPDETERRAVLRRRLDFLDEPSGFFFDGDRPLKRAELTDPYRQGILVTAKATRDAQRAWLRAMLAPNPPTS